MAIDDIGRDPSPPLMADEILQPLAFEFSSAVAFITTLRTGDRKVRLQAKKALVALDRVTACANADWRARVRFDGVGFFGFSFGGATERSLAPSIRASLRRQISMAGCLAARPPVRSKSLTW
jgi:hypothetical protein